MMLWACVTFVSNDCIIKPYLTAVLERVLFTCSHRNEDVQVRLCKNIQLKQSHSINHSHARTVSVLHDNISHLTFLHENNPKRRSWCRSDIQIFFFPSAHSIKPSRYTSNWQVDTHTHEYTCSDSVNHTASSLRAPAQHLPAALRSLFLLLLFLSSLSTLLPLPAGLLPLFILLSLSPSHRRPRPFGPWHGGQPRHPTSFHGGSSTLCQLKDSLGRFPEPGWSFFCVFLLQIPTLPTALTSFHRASLFMWVPSFPLKEGDISFPIMYLNILSLKITKISSAFSIFSFLFSSHAPSASVAECHSSDQLGFKMLLSPSPLLNPPPTVPSTSGRSTDKKCSGGGRKSEALKMNAASLSSTEPFPLRLQNGMSLSVRSSLWSRRRESENKHRRRWRKKRRRRRRWSWTVGAPHFIAQREVRNVGLDF